MLEGSVVLFKVSPHTPAPEVAWTLLGKFAGTNGGFAVSERCA